MRKIKATWKGVDIEGILVSETKDSKTIKLSSGYNIGVSNKELKDIELGEEIRIEDKAIEGEGDGEISILGCGGTISSEVDYSTGAVFPRMSPSFLKKSFPEIEAISTIKAKTIFNIFSEDMNAGHWGIMAESAFEELKDGKKGVVILHGTDTMHYSAAALSFAIADLNAPVIFTGAQRSSDRPSSDNKLNLLSSVFSATQDIAEVGIVMHAGINDDIAYYNRGNRTRKMHSSRRDAFKSINIPPLAKIDYKGKLFEQLCEYRKRGDSKPKLNNKFNGNVALVYTYPGMRKEAMKGLGGYDGIVIAGTGLGHIPTNPHNDPLAVPIIKEVKELCDSGIPVFMASQTIYGRINMDIYSAGRLIQEAGVIGNGLDMTPETAYVKLCWALGQEKNAKGVREIMETDVAGELSKRSSIAGYSPF
jgi:glutamyl-tRNA(Gln) amidotransferase subunit D